MKACLSLLTHSPGSCLTRAGPTRPAAPRQAIRLGCPATAGSRRPPGDPLGRALNPSRSRTSPARPSLPAIRDLSMDGFSQPLACGTAPALRQAPATFSARLARREAAYTVANINADSSGNSLTLERTEMKSRRNVNRSIQALIRASLFEQKMNEIDRP